MRISSIEAMNGKRSLIRTEEGVSFPLYNNEIREWKLVEGEAIEEQLTKTLMTEFLPKRAKLRAMHLLARKDYTCCQMSQKLTEGGYPEEVTAAAIEDLKGHRYLDDERYVRYYIDAAKVRKSRRQILYDLRAKGIDPDLAEAMYEELCEEEEEENIRKLLIKRRVDPENCPFPEQQKHIRYLIGKGYPAEKIRKVFKGRDCFD